MPNRILRDYTDSTAFDGISAEAERLFVRLLTKADDFGRFHANPKLVKAACFPLSEDLRANTIAAWLTELSDRQLVFCYTSGAGSYLALPKFGQRIRAESKSKFPPPDGEPPNWYPPQPAAGRGNPPQVAASYVFGDVDEGGVGDAFGAGVCPTVNEAMWVEQIQNAYPDRSSQRDTMGFIIAAMRSGTAPEVILQGTREAAALIAKVPTGIKNQYVPKAVGFFRGDKWRNPEVHIVVRTNGKPTPIGVREEGAKVEF